jgi:acetyl-CoA synthetase
VKGEGICCFVTLRDGEHESPQLETSLKMAVREAIGAFATPDIIVCTPAFPKTRSGKIMRRVRRRSGRGRRYVR